MAYSNDTSPLARGTSRGLPLIIVGLACAVLGQSLDGFLGGLLSGAAVVLLIFGAYLVGSTLWPWRDAKGRRRGGWLPSRDNE